MAREILTEGVVLRRWHAGEYDKWISFLTPEHGKVRLRVRGARKPKSKMGMLTEPLNLLKARVIEGRAQKLIAQPQLIRSYVSLRTDLERLSVALALCETLDRWLPEEHAEPEAYATLIVALEALEAGVPGEQAAAWALWRWLAVLGYCPDLRRCGRCGASFELVGGDADATPSVRVASASPPTSVILIPAEGVLLCPRCARSREGIELAPDALSLLQQWAQGESLRLGSRPEAYRSLMRAALRYAECTLESPVRWLEFWERLNTLRENG
ncbi:MAG: DNA repair protein RecO [Fimbriimonadales bacterium]|nr:DNA repair protein RecO [Fimbriimonadales bacterium]